ncbi:transposase [Sulfurimonas sp. SWIR-19]|uniref:transposase n=1 Tax=Sulfurimonas sp. SWIR-19 TaxID=2878390 RepID=UPI001CF55B2C|nr:transposase [Sulfurimonas sp. SWIR-19]UCN01108.1 transposase [Sulfurimonas sp. SWIR-19]
MNHTKLHHISLQEHYQFITFRTQESVDAYVQKILANDEKEHIKQFQIDNYLDSSKNGAYLYDEAIDVFIDVILQKDEHLYDVQIMAIMPNHIHILLKQNDDLGKIMQYIKGTSAVELNKLLHKSGKFWAEGYYDKLIRDEEHYVKVYNYIKNNPLKAGLKDERVFSKYE